MIIVVHTGCISYYNLCAQRNEKYNNFSHIFPTTITDHIDPLRDMKPWIFDNLLLMDF